MSRDLSEVELLDQIKQNLRMCAEDCGNLANAPRYGQIYVRMRQRLKEIEVACNQVAVHRNGDARWLPMGMMMEEIHQRTGHWLRAGQALAARQSRAHLFRKLAEKLREAHAGCIALETRRTGRADGLILPKPLPFHREHRPVQVLSPVRKSAGGVILPDGYAG